jgi:hypothetical protein
MSIDLMHTLPHHLPLQEYHATVDGSSMERLRIVAALAARLPFLHPGLTSLVITDPTPPSFRDCQPPQQLCSGYRRTAAEVLAGLQSLQSLQELDVDPTVAVFPDTRPLRNLARLRRLRGGFVCLDVGCLPSGLTSLVADAAVVEGRGGAGEHAAAVAELEEQLQQVQQQKAAAAEEEDALRKKTLDHQ